MAAPGSGRSPRPGPNDPRGQLPPFGHGYIGIAAQMLLGPVVDIDWLRANRSRTGLYAAYPASCTALT